MTIKEVLKHTRALCKSQGATLRRSNYSLNCKPLYYFIERKTGNILLSNMLLMSAYENALNDSIKTAMERRA
jgi:hypothetical protein